MYTYENLLEDIAYLSYIGVDTGSIGKSALGLEIPYIHVGGYAGRQLIVTGGIHARENVTSLLVARQAFKAALELESNKTGKAGYGESNTFCDVGAGGQKGGIYFLPMLNPDGAVLIELSSLLGKEGDEDSGLDAFEAKLDLYDLNHGDFWGRLQKAIKINGGSRDFLLWKANINGVDLNNNFDARFAAGAGQVGAPAPAGYHGGFAFSQPETAALEKFTLSVAPAMTVSYHALGREVYWNFFQTGNSLSRDMAIAKKVADTLGYKLIATDMDSSGGYKDWCVSALKIPALTIEIIDEKHSHPLNLKVLDEDWAANMDLPKLLLEMDY